MTITLAERLRARAEQMGLNAREVAEQARVNRSFVYDIMRGRSERPNLEKLDKVAAIIKVDRNWLLHGKGVVDGDEPVMEDEADAFVAIPSVQVTASMGGGKLVADEVENGEPYHFRSSWITHRLRANPANLRIMHVEGDSMMPTLHDGDVVLVDLARCMPTPPGIFVLFDGMGLVAKRLEHIPNSEPPQVRIISDNTFYSPYERTADEIRIIGRIRWFGREI
ncbi:phage repressor protein C with HTH and peptisase S24 domain [Ochrobactrum sp. J50]|uniref:XRE family transcriptional regulator n=1 Tax=Ochrobactrum sp. J50 TaxID=936132 RepID=UPI00119CDC55|nr:S24 family peptidase [Ochrobactrum sp. J50]TWG99190.1 phage repressor protein C with HTH and peptisase S24 domain [Ochrobactrum sp. J50]